MFGPWAAILIALRLDRESNDLYSLCITKVTKVDDNDELRDSKKEKRKIYEFFRLAFDTFQS